MEQEREATFPPADPSLLVASQYAAPAPREGIHRWGRVFANLRDARSGAAGPETCDRGLPRRPLPVLCQGRPHGLTPWPVEERTAVRTKPRGARWSWESESFARASWRDHRGWLSVASHQACLGARFRTSGVQRALHCPFNAAEAPTLDVMRSGWRSPSLFLHSGRPYSLHAAAAPALREPADTTQARLGECRTLADVRRCLEDAESSVGFEDALLGLSIGTAYLRRRLAAESRGQMLAGRAAPTDDDVAWMAGTVQATADAASPTDTRACLVVLRASSAALAYLRLCYHDPATGADSLVLTQQTLATWPPTFTALRERACQLGLASLQCVSGADFASALRLLVSLGLRLEPSSPQAASLSSRIAAVAPTLGHGLAAQVLRCTAAVGVDDARALSAVAEAVGPLAALGSGMEKGAARVREAVDILRRESPSALQGLSASAMAVVSEAMAGVDAAGLALSVQERLGGAKSIQDVATVLEAAGGPRPTSVATFHAVVRCANLLRDKGRAPLTYRESRFLTSLVAAVSQMSSGVHPRQAALALASLSTITRDVAATRDACQPGDLVRLFFRQMGQIHDPRVVVRAIQASVRLQPPTGWEDTHVLAHNAAIAAERMSLPGLVRTMQALSSVGSLTPHTLLKMLRLLVEKVKSDCGARRDEPYAHDMLLHAIQAGLDRWWVAGEGALTAPVVLRAAVDATTSTLCVTDGARLAEEAVGALSEGQSMSPRLAADLRALFSDLPDASLDARGYSSKPRTMPYKRAKTGSSIAEVVEAVEEARPDSVESRLRVTTAALRRLVKLQASQASAPDVAEAAAATVARAALATLGEARGGADVQDGDGVGSDAPTLLGRGVLGQPSDGRADAGVVGPSATVQALLALAQTTPLPDDVVAQVAAAAGELLGPQSTVSDAERLALLEAVDSAHWTGCLGPHTPGLWDAVESAACSMLARVAQDKREAYMDDNTAAGRQEGEGGAGAGTRRRSSRAVAPLTAALVACPAPRPTSIAAALESLRFVGHQLPNPVAAGLWRRWAAAGEASGSTPELSPLAARLLSRCRLMAERGADQRSEGVAGAASPGREEGLRALATARSGAQVREAMEAVLQSMVEPNGSEVAVAVRGAMVALEDLQRGSQGEGSPADRRGSDEAGEGHGAGGAAVDWGADWVARLWDAAEGLAMDGCMDGDMAARLVRVGAAAAASGSPAPRSAVDALVRTALRDLDTLRPDSLVSLLASAPASGHPFTRDELRDLQASASDWVVPDAPPRVITGLVRTLHASGALDASTLVAAVESLIGRLGSLTRDQRADVFSAYRSVFAAARADTDAAAALARVSQEGVAVVNACAAPWFDKRGTVLAARGRRMRSARGPTALRDLLDVPLPYRAAAERGWWRDPALWGAPAPPELLQLAFQRAAPLVAEAVVAATLALANGARGSLGGRQPSGAALGESTDDLRAVLRWAEVEGRVVAGGESDGAGRESRTFLASRFPAVSDATRRAIAAAVQGAGPSGAGITALDAAPDAVTAPEGRDLRGLLADLSEWYSAPVTLSARQVAALVPEDLAGLLAALARCQRVRDELGLLALPPAAPSTSAAVAESLVTEPGVAADPGLSGWPLPQQGDDLGPVDAFPSMRADGSVGLEPDERRQLREALWRHSKGRDAWAQWVAASDGALAPGVARAMQAAAPRLGPGSLDAALGALCDARVAAPAETLSALTARVAELAPSMSPTTAASMLWSTKRLGMLSPDILRPLLLAAAGTGPEGAGALRAGQAEAGALLEVLRAESAAMIVTPLPAEAAAAVAMLLHRLGADPDTDQALFKALGGQGALEGSMGTRDERGLRDALLGAVASAGSSGELLAALRALRGTPGAGDAEAMGAVADRARILARSGVDASHGSEAGDASKRDDGGDSHVREGRRQGGAGVSDVRGLSIVLHEADAMLAMHLQGRARAVRGGDEAQATDREAVPKALLAFWRAHQVLSKCAGTNVGALSSLAPALEILRESHAARSLDSQALSQALPVACLLQRGPGVIHKAAVAGAAFVGSVNASHVERMVATAPDWGAVLLAARLLTRTAPGTFSDRAVELMGRRHALEVARVRERESERRGSGGHDGPGATSGVVDRWTASVGHVWRDVTRYRVAKNTPLPALDANARGTLDAAAASLSIGAGTDPVNALPDFREAWTVGQVLGSLRRTLALRGAEDDAAGAMRLEALKRCAEIAVTIPKLRVLRAGGLLSPLLTRGGVGEADAPWPTPSEAERQELSQLAATVAETVASAKRGSVRALQAIGNLVRPWTVQPAMLAAGRRPVSGEQVRAAEEQLRVACGWAVSVPPDAVQRALGTMARDVCEEARDAARWAAAVGAGEGQGSAERWNRLRRKARVLAGVAVPAAEAAGALDARGVADVIAAANAVDEVLGGVSNHPALRDAVEVVYGGAKDSEAVDAAPGKVRMRIAVASRTHVRRGGAWWLPVDVLASAIRSVGQRSSREDLEWLAARLSPREQALAELLWALASRR